MRLSEALAGVGRPVAYLPGLAKLLGGVKACVLFCQLFYWSQRTDESGWFWKSQEGLCDETGLTIDELRAARKQLAELGLLQSRYARIEHRLYFKLDRRRLDDLWASHNGHIGNSDVVNGEFQNGHVGKVDFGSDGPETTEETTQRFERNGQHRTQGESKKTDSETETTVTPEDLVEAWNDHCVPLGLPAVSELSKKRRKDALAVIHEHPLQSWWEVVLGRIGKSRLLKGQVKPAGSFGTPFQATLDWLLRDDNALKVYEGQYRG